MKSLDYVAKEMSRYGNIQINTKSDDIGELLEKSMSKTSVDFIFEDESIPSTNFSLIYCFITFTRLRDIITKPERLEESKHLSVEICFEVKKQSVEFLMTINNIVSLIGLDKTISVKYEKEIKEDEIERGIQRCIFSRSGKVTYIFSHENGTWLVSFTDPFIIFFVGAKDKKSFITKFESVEDLIRCVQKYVFPREIDRVTCLSIQSL